MAKQRKGIGTVIATVIFIFIMLFTVGNLYMWYFSKLDEYNRAVEEMMEEDIKRQSENLQISNVEFYLSINVGDGSDGDLTVSNGQTIEVDNVKSALRRRSPEPLVTRVRNVTTTGFEVKVQEEESQYKTSPYGYHVEETVSWIAATPGNGTNNGIQYLFGVTPSAVDEAWYTITFSPSFPSAPLFLAWMQTTNGGDTAGVRYRNLTATSAQVRIEEEQSYDSETGHAYEAVAYFAFEEAGTLVDGNGETIGEVGTVNITEEWTTVNLTHTYENPVVIAQPLSNNNTEPAHARVKNVTSSSFQIQVEEWAYLDGEHPSETVFYLVMEAGAHTFPDGRLVEAGTVSAGGRSSANDVYVSVTYPQSFTSTPAVLAQPQSLRAVVAVSTVTGFQDGQEVLIIQMDGEGAGHWETRNIESVSTSYGNELVLEGEMNYAYYQSDTYGDKAQVIRVPHYNNVTVENGGTLTTSAWNGSTGGVLFFRAKGDVTVENGGTITMTGKGFTGGSRGGGGAGGAGGAGGRPRPPYSMATGGGGGGAGGSIWLTAYSLDLGTNLVTSVGGSGGRGGVGGAAGGPDAQSGAAGGDGEAGHSGSSGASGSGGSVGRIRLDYVEKTGTTNPPPGHEETVEANRIIFTVQNLGSETLHLAALWVIHGSSHERYDSTTNPKFDHLRGSHGNQADKLHLQLGEGGILHFQVCD